MKKRRYGFALATLGAAILAAAGSAKRAEAAPLEDGTYLAEFVTDSTMFHVNEVDEGFGVLTVEGGEMTIHVSLVSKRIVNLYVGLAIDAEKVGEDLLLQPTVDVMNYPDGTTGEVYGFDVPVPALDEKFDLALIGTKGKWYDHRVYVTNPEPLEGFEEFYDFEELGLEEDAFGLPDEEALLAEFGLDAEFDGEYDEDQAAADEVAMLIDELYAPYWTEETAEQCAAAKAAWDALTDEQKALVEGDDANARYFGLDTGDASADDPGNADGIGEKEILVVSYGTSYNSTRVEDICGIEEALAEAYPEWSVRRAFSSQVIINHILAREGYAIDNVEQAIARAAANGVKQLVVQPTFVMHGTDFEELLDTLKAHRDEFEKVRLADPLFTKAAYAEGGDEELRAFVEAIIADENERAGFGSAGEAFEAGTAYVFVGRGSSHGASVLYRRIREMMTELGYENAYVGTVLGTPEETSFEAVTGELMAGGYTKVVLRPLTVTAGELAWSDLEGLDGDENSWKNMLLEAGAFESVECRSVGLGSIPAVQRQYVGHSECVIGDSSS